MHLQNPKPSSLSGSWTMFHAHGILTLRSQYGRERSARECPGVHEYTQGAVSA